MAAPKATAESGLTLGNMNAATQLAVIIGALVMVGVLYYLLFYQPFAATLQSEQAREASIRSQESQAQRDLNRYNEDVAALERSRTRQRELRRILPDNPDIPGFLRSINNLAEASGLQIRLIQPQDEHPEQYYVRVPVRIEVTGSYLALARFFRAVSALPRVINMENIALSTPVEENGEIRLHATALATTFRTLRSDETPPPAPGAAGARPGAPAAGGARR